MCAYITNVKEETLQVRELSGSQREQAGVFIGDSARKLLICSQGIW